MMDSYTNSISKAIADKIRLRLWSLKLKKVKFAEQIGVAPSEVTKWLSDTHNFSLQTLCKIEQHLDIKIFAEESNNRFVDYFYDQLNNVKSE